MWHLKLNISILVKPCEVWSIRRVYPSPFGTSWQYTFAFSELHFGSSSWNRRVQRHLVLHIARSAPNGHMYCKIEIILPKHEQINHSDCISINLAKYAEVSYLCCYMHWTIWLNIAICMTNGRFPLFSALKKTHILAP